MSARSAASARSLRRPSGLPAAVLLAAGLFFSGPAAAAEKAGRGSPPPEPAGYKMEDYRTATPATLNGARVVDTRRAEALWRDKSAVFIDTMPRDARPSNLPPGTVWRDKPRDHISGSAWLANVGYGEISAEMTGYFKASLTALSGGDLKKPLLFYCRADCWMSWNAAKRAMSWGYGEVLWYPEGTDGWADAGLALEPAKPYALPGTPPSQ